MPKITFTLEELRYIYDGLDVKFHQIGKKIEKKLRKVIPEYREFDKKK